jgi:hypothetical protein
MGQALGEQHRGLGDHVGDVTRRPALPDRAPVLP